MKHGENEHAGRVSRGSGASAVVTLTAEVDARRAPPGEHALAVVFEVRTGAGRPVEQGRPPISAVLALDVSGSMAGPPLQQVIASVERIVDLLGPGDRLGVVAFSGGAAEVVELGALDASHRRVVRARVARLTSGGGTNVEAGLREAVAMHDRAPSPEARVAERPGRRAIILLSDGQANAGLASPSELGALARQIRQRASISTLGYGAHHDDAMLEAIASGGGGAYRYVPDPTLAQLEIAQAVGAQADVVAERLALVVAPESGVRIEGFVGEAHPRYEPEGLVLPLRDMSAHGVQVAVMRVRATLTDPSRGGRLVTAKLRFAIPGAPALHEVDAAAALDVGGASLTPNHAAGARVLFARADEARARARALADRGQFDGAAAILRGVLADVEVLLHVTGAEELGDARAALEEARELLIDEATAMERHPDPEAYGEFRRQTQAVGGTAALSTREGAHSRAFGGGASGPVPEAYLVVTSGAELGRRHRLGPTCVLGRTVSADIAIVESSVSRRHARVFHAHGRFWATDLGSTNATLLNGKPLGSAPLPLSRGDEIAVGSVKLVFEPA
ncbi:MAG: VWA domain-containing protein [Myxococcales bacterium]|nr:VWA domain-containing protein [Myxococcales bacterium]